MRILGGLITLIIITLLSVDNASAQSLCADGTGTIPPPGTRITSALGPRNLSGSNMHRGTDYGMPEGTPIVVPEGCEFANSSFDDGGWGHYVQFDCGTNSAGEAIRLQYGHLSNQSFDSTTRTLTSGNTGRSTGAHLDFIMTVDGNIIDAQCATGTVDRSAYVDHGSGPSNRHGIPCPIEGTPNLCDPSVTAQLIQHGQQVLGSRSQYGGIASAGTGTPPAPPTGPTGQGQSGGGPSINPDGSPIIVPGPNGGPIGNYPREPGDPRDPYVIPPSIPFCNTTTCITTETVLTAEHGYVDFQDLETDLDRLRAGDCLPPINTGLTVFRQYAGEIEEYPDRFCTNKGCSYLRENECVN